MSNENCLADIKCPKCGALEPFCIEATVVVRVYDDGTEQINSGGIDWNDDSVIVCDACEFMGTVKQFAAAPPTALDAVKMVLAACGWEGYTASDAEICDAIDWQLLRDVAARETTNE